ncbi:fumarylacetoacetate hydrolase family protein [Membranihabitans maritimus]|uniref:fumarylacetoacetate hydrolase family protein n=1 Tax=Membranihabitans maritimus TaxID=2904244 RepID=UPI001F2C04E8|nr:fumarylacetoacetate hydrolase family protein [Membranihabitans maritimus]
MKIFCVGRNYTAHAQELDNPVPDEPLIFTKPSTALLTHNQDFRFPDFSEEIHYEGEVVIRISKTGKDISPMEAQYYFDQIAFGIDFTARDIQRKLKEKGHPWEIAKGFDGSAAISSFLSINNVLEDNIYFETLRNGLAVQTGNTRDMIFSYTDIIVYLSKYFTLEVGDIIFTGTPEGVGPVRPGDLLEGVIDGRKVLSCKII